MAMPSTHAATEGTSPERAARLDGAVQPLRRHPWRDPSYQAYVVLRLAFVALPLAMGINHILPGTAQQIMYGVGGVEILAGVLVALKPRYASYVVSAWLLGIVVNLFSSGKGFYDIGARDLVLMVAAFALARLASRWDPPLALERRLHRAR